jgi:protein SCO1/2
MKTNALPYWLALMVVVAASYGAWKWWQVQQFQTSRSTGGLEFDGPPLEEFELTERSGQPFRSRDMEGKVWVATFFFATCPGSCSRLNANIQHLHNLEQLRDVTWVSITVDPQTDTLEKLREYADHHQADPERWLFCRGEFDYVRRVGRDFMNVDVGYQSHQDTAVVIDKAGKIRGMYNAIRLSELEKLQKLLVKLIDENPPAGPDPNTEEASPTNS